MLDSEMSIEFVAENDTESRSLKSERVRAMVGAVTKSSAFNVGITRAVSIFVITSMESDIYPKPNIADKSCFEQSIPYKQVNSCPIIPLVQSCITLDNVSVPLRQAFSVPLSAPPPGRISSSFVVLSRRRRS